ncbi:hypothetical protein Hbut_0170 [Hyperthermus butylicus DSM 5456]|uniref:Uncharacterized protein n=1 Tax=Hyperthermus butylicus (strain DSM 5456 / JCM 9403 / PLM1-5) TaxID=415426 RepID=A2BJ81_HYPBU|nr:hypothetical protein Hbut_0170 [Hyperthermus butylicus DSM 5456]
MVSVVRILVPFHLARLGDRIVGLDAYFWGQLSERYRVVLLVHPAENLLDERDATGCKLPVNVTFEEQLRDIEEVSEIRTPRPKLPRIGPGKRLLTLLMPAMIIYQELKAAMKLVEVPEEAQARNLAKMLRNLEPLNVLGYAVFERQGDLILPAREGTMKRIYSELASRDEGYRQACLDAIRRCKA